MSRYDELTGLVEGLGTDFNKFYGKGNKAAGTRVRKGMQSLKVWAQEVRKEVQSKKNAWLIIINLIILLKGGIFYHLFYLIFLR